MHAWKTYSFVLSIIRNLVTVTKSPFAKKGLPNKTSSEKNVFKLPRKNLVKTKTKAWKRFASLFHFIKKLETGGFDVGSPALMKCNQLAWFSTSFDCFNHNICTTDVARTICTSNTRPTFKRYLLLPSQINISVQVLLVMFCLTDLVLGVHKIGIFMY